MIVPNIVTIGYDIQDTKIQTTGLGIENIGIFLHADAENFGNLMAVNLMAVKLMVVKLVLSVAPV